MPTYEYKCKHCKHQFETLQGITEKPRVRCPKCRRNGLERLISAGAGVIFKGSGFYATDYSRGSSGSERPPSARPRGGARDETPAGAGHQGGNSDSKGADSKSPKQDSDSPSS